MPPTPDPDDAWPGAAAPADAEARLARSAEGATLGLPRVEAEQYVAVRAETVEPFYLLLYAQRDEKDALRVHQALAPELGSRDCPWPARDWHRPDAGDPIEATRRAWLRDARFVLVLASPALIDDLKNHGLTLDSARPLRILALDRVTDDQCRGTPLAGLPIFADQGAAPWTARGGPGRKQWVRDAAAWLLGAIRDSEPAPDPFARLRRPDWDRFGDLPDGHYVHQHTEVSGAPAGRVAIELLRDWLADPEASVLCAVFGELGMGKTTLCQRLTRELLKGRDAGKPLPLPVYLDLRAVNTMDWDWSRGAPPLPAMLEHIVAAAYDLGVDEPRPSAADIARLAQQGGGLILCDGLDEVMNRLTPEQCRLFIERLWSILPPKFWKPPPGLTPAEAQAWHRPPGVGRLLMTCRSHFFQTLQDQVNALIGQQRAPIARADYLWATLLPFEAQQVETYFRQVFAADPAQAERVIAMLDQVHDLKELGSRPYNLRLIQDQVDELEAIQREGRRVSIADLYEGLVGQWMLRDDPKHRLNRDHKLLLMERLALRLWAGGEKHLGYQALNDWLVAQVRTEPGWCEVEYWSYLARDGGVEVLKEDLRNATFLVREGEDRFRFAHTSIQEFFLARALHRALLEDRLDDWAVAVPSAETLEFLGGLIAGRETAACLAALGRIRAGYRARISELALAYALSAYARDMPGADVTGFQLPGAELRFQRWEGREDRSMDWRGSDLSGARLRGGRFSDCDFRGSRFDRADLTRTLFDRCRLDRVSAPGVDLTGAVLHQCTADGADLADARLYHCQWLGNLPVPVAGVPPALFIAAGTPPPPGSRSGSSAGNTGPARGIQVDPAGRWLASGGDDGRLVLWDLRSGRVLHALEGHAGGVSALAAGPDGRWLAAAGGDGSLRLWDPARGRALQTLEGHRGGVTVLVAPPDGRWLASAGADGRVCLWDPARGRALHTLEGHRGEVKALAVAPDGRWLASAGEDGTVRLWDPARGRALHCLEGHRGWVWVLVAPPDGRWLASAGSDGRVCLWDPGSGRALHALEGYRSGVLELAAAPDGRWLAAGGQDGSLRLWDPGSGRALHALAGRGGALVAAPDGRWLAATGEDGRVHLWDPVNGRALRALEGHVGWLSALAVAPDGRWLAAADDDGTVRLWDAGTGRVLHALEERRPWIGALAAAPDGSWLAFGGADPGVHRWDPAGGQGLRALEGHMDGVGTPVAAPDGGWLATAGAGGRVRLWDPATGRALRTLAGHEHGVMALAASPDGRWLASADRDGTLRLRDLRSGRALHVLTGEWNSLRALAVAPDGRWLAAAYLDDMVRLWDPTSGRALHTLEGHRDAVEVLAVAPDGRWLASASWDGTVRLWDPARGRALHTLEGHRDWVEALAVAPDGRWLASAGRDGTVRLWDPARGRALHTLDGHSGVVGALAAAADGRWLASTGADGWIRLWTLPPDGAKPFCARAIEHLPEGNWVTWHDPDGPNRRWVRWSRDAWRWLGWHAPLPDGEHWMYHPMDAFRAAPTGSTSPEG